MRRFFRSAAFPILIVVVLAFFAQRLISPTERKEDPSYNQFIEQVDNGQIEEVTFNTKDNTLEVKETDAAGGASGADLITLHIYSPALLAMHMYSILDAKVTAPGSGKKAQDALVKATQDLKSLQKQFAEHAKKLRAELNQANQRAMESGSAARKEKEQRDAAEKHAVIALEVGERKRPGGGSDRPAVAGPRHRARQGAAGKAEIVGKSEKGAAAAAGKPVGDVQCEGSGIIRGGQRLRGVAERPLVVVEHDAPRRRRLHRAHE